MTDDDFEQAIRLNTFLLGYFIIIFTTSTLLTFILSIDLLANNSYTINFIRIMSGPAPTIKELGQQSNFPQTSMLVYSIALVAIPFLAKAPSRAFQKYSSYLQKKRSREMGIITIIGLLLVAFSMMVLLNFTIFNSHHPAGRGQMLYYLIKLSFTSRLTFGFVISIIVWSTSILLGRITAIKKLLPKLKPE